MTLDGYRRLRGLALRSAMIHRGRISQLIASGELRTIHEERLRTVQRAMIDIRREFYGP